jgi:hypothetical protein
MAFTEKKLAELREKYGDAFVPVETPFGDFAFRTPALEDWERHQEAIKRSLMPNSKGTLSASNREVAQLSLDDPGQLQDLKNLFAKRPAAASMIVEQLGELAGADIEFVIKKG